jgi:hypothetical protein
MFEVGYGRGEEQFDSLFANPRALCNNCSDEQATIPFLLFVFYHVRCVEKSRILEDERVTWNVGQKCK